MMSRVYQLAGDIEEMPRGYFSIIGATFIALSSMDAMAETPPPATSGIEGTVLVSPSRPGPIGKDDEPSVAPVRNTRFVIKAGDSAIATFTTDGEGRFRIALPPGHYVVLREDAPPSIGRWQFEADVRAGEMTKVNWTADSGMR